MVEFKAWPPVGRPKERLQSTGQVHEHVTHQEKPVQKKTTINCMAVHSYKPNIKDIIARNYRTRVEMRFVCV